jgi:hypothetical protein
VLFRREAAGEDWISDQPKGVDSTIQVDAERLAHVQLACFRDENLGKLGVDAPVPLLVCRREGVAGRAGTDAGVVKPRLQGTKADLDVAQALAIGELREHHDK